MSVIKNVKESVVGHVERLGRMLVVCFTLVMLPVGVATAAWEGLGPYEVFPFAVERDPHKPQIAYAGTYFGGLYRSVDNGFNWQLLDTPFSGLTVFDIGFDPTAEGAYYVATFQGGIFRTLDDGASWTAINNGIADLTVQEIAVDPFNSDRLIATTFLGVYLSEDRGESWVLSNGGQGQLPAKAIAFHPNQQSVVYVGTLDNAGIYRSDDGGVTWVEFNLGQFYVDIQKLRFDDQTGTLLYGVSSQAAAFRLNAEATTWTRISDGLPLGPNSDILPHPLDNNVLFMANGKGVYVSVDAGGTWFPSYLLETDLARTFRLMADPITGVVHAANLKGPGLVVSSDFGTSWFPTLDSFQNMFIGAIATVSAFGNTVIYAGSDRGVTQASPLYVQNGRWEWSKPENFLQTIFEIEPHPTQPGVVFAGTERVGVFKSNDWGISWSQSADGIVPYTTHAMAQSPLPPYNMYAGTSSGFWTSKDLGASWVEHEELSIPEITALATSPTISGYMLVGVEDGRVYRSPDNGETVIYWTTGLSGLRIRDLAISADGTAICITTDGSVFRRELADPAWTPVRYDPDNPAFTVTPDPVDGAVIYLGTIGTGVQKSVDSGRTWTPANTGIDLPYITEIAVRGDSPGELYAATGQRVYRSTDGGQNWSGHSDGLPSGQIVELLPHAEAPDVLYASIENQGLFWSGDRGQTWAKAFSYGFIGGSAPLLQDVTNSANLFAGVREVGVVKSPDHGVSWSPSSSGMSVFIRSIAFDPSNDSILHAGSLKDGVFRSTDGGSTWSYSGLAGTFVLDLEIDPLNPNTLYAATAQGVAKSVDGGITWALPDTPARIDGGPAFVLSLEIDPTNPDVIYAVTGGSGLFKSIDGAASWIAINSGAGDLKSYLTLELDTGNPQRLYAGSAGGGVLVTEDGGQTWNVLNDGLINKTVTSLAIDPINDRIVYAGTEGGGVFRIDQDTN